MLGLVAVVLPTGLLSALESSTGVLTIDGELSAAEATRVTVNSVFVEFLGFARATNRLSTEFAVPMGCDCAVRFDMD